MAVFLAVTFGGGAVAISQLDAASNSQVQLLKARDDLDALLSAQLYEETGLRGFVATGDTYFLEPDSMPGDTFESRANSLELQLRDAKLPPEIIARVESLRSIHRVWVAEVEQPLLDDPSRRDSLAKQKRGKLYTDQMRSDAAILQTGLADAGDEVQRVLRRRVNTTVAVSVGVIAIVAIVALVLGLSRAQAVAALAHEQSLVLALQQTLRVAGVQLPRTRVGYSYTSATREALVGGDLIDTWRTDADRGWFLIADVSGKGVDAARHSAFVQYAIRTLAAESDDPGDILARFNRLFLETFDEPTIFVVLFLGAFDARTGVMRYASAGHAGAFICNPHGVRQLDPTGPIIGLGPGETYEVCAVPLMPGETVVLATDGLTEARDASGAMLGEEGVMQMLASSNEEPQAICDRLVAEVERRSNGEVTDDMAILALRIAAVDDRSTRPFSTLGAS